MPSYYHQNPYFTSGKIRRKLTYNNHKHQCKYYQCKLIKQRTVTVLVKMFILQLSISTLMNFNKTINGRLPPPPPQYINMFPENIIPLNPMKRDTAATIQKEKAFQESTENNLNIRRNTVLITRLCR